MGLGQVYLNLAGREEQGIVAPADAAALAREIREKLLAIRNPYLPDDRPIREVYLLKEVYHGPEIDACAEIQIGFEGVYRVSWQTALLGGMGRPVFEHNTRPWSGDHCSNDVTVVPGVVLSNRFLPEAPAGRPWNVRDIAATVCAFFGLDTSDLDAEPIPLEDPRAR
jgi:predicted AlkP superfamily phosphohydrolase/phosphomutase